MHPIEPSVGRWTGSPKPRSKSDVAIVAACWIGACAIVWPLPHFFTSFGIIPVLFALMVQSHKGFGPGPTRDDRQLLETADDDVCLVDLTIYRDAEQIGKDRGVAWFEGGQLLFNGHLTSFVLGGQDVLPKAQWSKLRLPNREVIVRESYLPLKVNSGEAIVDIKPVRTLGLASPSEMRFLKRFYEYQRRPPTSSAPRQWPPFEPPPTLARK